MQQLNRSLQGEMDPENASPTIAPATAPKRSALSAMLYWARDLIFSVMIAIVVILFIYQPVKVEGTSMMPALDDQERIFINKFVYRLEPIERGDIVVFRYPR